MIDYTDTNPKLLNLVTLLNEKFGFSHKKVVDILNEYIELCKSSSTKAKSTDAWLWNNFSSIFHKDVIELVNYYLTDIKAGTTTIMTHLERQEFLLNSEIGSLLSNER